MLRTYLLLLLHHRNNKLSNNNNLLLPCVCVCIPYPYYLFLLYSLLLYSVKDRWISHGSDPPTHIIVYHNEGGDVERNLAGNDSFMTGLVAVAASVAAAPGDKCSYGRDVVHAYQLGAYVVTTVRPSPFFFFFIYLCYYYFYY